MPNVAMRQPGTQFSGDGLNLSWPLGGEREVVGLEDDQLTLRIRRRIAEGSIVITDEKANKVSGEGEREYRLLTGEDARRHFAEPAGPVTRVVYHPATPEDERGFQLEVQDARMDSPTYLEAQAKRAEQAEIDHADIGKRQSEAEKEAAKQTSEAEEVDDPIAERLRRTEEASAEWVANAEKSFMEREAARQKEENEVLKAAPTPPKETADDAADEAFMEAEKARQKIESDTEKERQKAAKDAEGAPVVNGGWAGKTDPYVGSADVGRRPAATITSADRVRPETTEKPKPKASTASKPKAAPKKATKSKAKAPAKKASAAPAAAPVTAATEPTPVSNETADAIATENLGGHTPSELADGSNNS